MPEKLAADGKGRDSRSSSGEAAGSDVKEIAVNPGGAAEWARHYDNLLWTVTSIFLAANGALLVHCSQKANFLWPLAVGGQLITVLTVYFAASFRELRYRAVQQLDPGLQVIWMGRRLYQWQAFVALFMVLILGWAWLLVHYAPGRLPWWLMVTIAASACTLLVGRFAARPRRQEDHK